jgi:kynurenine formamidase
MCHSFTAFSPFSQQLPALNQLPISSFCLPGQVVKLMSMRSNYNQKDEKAILKRSQVIQAYTVKTQEKRNKKKPQHTAYLKSRFHHRTPVWAFSGQQAVYS